MSADDDDDSFPRSMRHRQVLDAAEEHPDASIEEIASMVPSATADLVEHVFEEHGDPAAEDEQPAEPAEPEPSSEDGRETGESPAESAPDSAKASVEDADESGAGAPDGDETGLSDVALDELSDRQRELLEVVAARPDATQAEIADHFGVTRATVSRWASEIDGFEWNDRAEVVARTFEAAAVSTDGGSTAETAHGGSDGETPMGPDDAEGGIAARLDRLESRLADLESAGSAAGDGVDVELAHKIAHACLQSEAISEDEELRILEWLLE